MLLLRPDEPTQQTPSASLRCLNLAAIKEDGPRVPRKRYGAAITNVSRR